MRRLQAGRQKAAASNRQTYSFPRPVIMNGERLPASYANFYVANGRFSLYRHQRSNDRVDSMECRSISRRAGSALHAVDLVWAFGTLHCLTQQQPGGKAVRK